MRRIVQPELGLLGSRSCFGLLLLQEHQAVVLDPLLPQVAAEADQHIATGIHTAHAAPLPSSNMHAPAFETSPRNHCVPLIKENLGQVHEVLAVDPLLLAVFSETYVRIPIHIDLHNLSPLPTKQFLAIIAVANEVLPNDDQVVHFQGIQVNDLKIVVDVVVAVRCDGWLHTSLVLTSFPSFSSFARGLAQTFLFLLLLSNPFPLQLLLPRSLLSLSFCFRSPLCFPPFCLKSFLDRALSLPSFTVRSLYKVCLAVTNVSKTCSIAVTSR
mmetsp:Transcript_53875/g.117934  ORF Transcript_53875/g.117934 Transcript_53875/m.117934 type:complete len:270 (+) Transcript_53875:1878-2687(+)